MNPPVQTTRREWHDNYLHELKDLYYILYNEVVRDYPHVIVDDEIAFHNFSRMIYQCSSKFTSDYTVNASLKHVGS